MKADSLVKSMIFDAPQCGSGAADFVDACSESFLTHGAVVINNVFSSDFLDEVNRSYQVEYGHTIDASREVGDKRTMIAIDVKSPFNGQALIAPDLVTPVIQRLIGEDYILVAYTAVTSRPDSADQHVHVDFPLLFSEDMGMSQAIPPYAITLAIPLIPLNALTGVTRVWPGTHRHGFDWNNAQPDLMQSLSIIPKYGGCYLFDARLLHGGTANYTQAERPILYLVFCRPWWRDSVNFYNQKPLIIGDGALAELPTSLQAMFRHIK